MFPYLKALYKKNFFNFYIWLNRFKVKWYSSFPLRETFRLPVGNPQGLEELNSNNRYSKNLASFFYLLLIGASCAIFILHKGQLFSLSKLLIFCSFVGYILLQILGFLAENICYILPLISIILNLFIDRLSGIPIFRKINFHRYLGGRVFIKQGLLLIFVGWTSYFLYNNFQSTLINIIESPYFLIFIGGCIFILINKFKCSFFCKFRLWCIYLKSNYLYFLLDKFLLICSIKSTLYTLILVCNNLSDILGDSIINFDFIVTLLSSYNLIFVFLGGGILNNYSIKLPILPTMEGGGLQEEGYLIKFLSEKIGKSE